MSDKHKPSTPPSRPPQQPLRKNDAPKSTPKREHANDQKPTIRDTIEPPPRRK